METHDVQPNTEKWLMLRAYYDTASEAPAMKSASKYMTRDQLLKQKQTGESEPVDSYLQALFDKGHAAEASIRPHIEKIIGLELYPVTGSIEVDGLSLLASFDGLTMAETINFEHKLWNERLAEQVRNNDLDDQYKWQMDQQMIVSGAEKTIFVVSDGTPDKMEFCWYEVDVDRFVQLLAGWQQFKIDLANYVYIPEPELIKAESVMSLPAVSIKVDGTIILIDNLDVFGETLKGYIERINKSPETDQDFANLEAAVKTLKQAEDSLSAAENGALAQAADIDTMRRTVELYRSMARDNRLIFDKVVKTQKEAIKTGIFQDARDALMKHVSLLNEGLGAQYVQYNADFKGVMKGKRGKNVLTSLRSAANDELARAKIEANEQAEKYRANLKILNNTAADYKFLFNDLAAIIGKESSDFVLLVNARVAEHQKAEQDAVQKATLEAEQAAQAVIDEAARKQQEEIKEKEKQRVKYYESMIKHINQCAHGFIGGEPQSFGVLFYELNDKIIIDDSWGEFEAPAIEARSKALSTLKKLQETARLKTEDEEKRAAECKQLEAEQAVETAMQIERNRIENERLDALEKDRQVKAADDAKKATQEHRAKIHGESRQSLMDHDFDFDEATMIVSLIADGTIKNIQVIY